MTSQHSTSPIMYNLMNTCSVSRVCPYPYSHQAYPFAYHCHTPSSLTIFPSTTPLAPPPTSSLPTVPLSPFVSISIWSFCRYRVCNVGDVYVSVSSSYYLFSTIIQLFLSIQIFTRSEPLCWTVQLYSSAATIRCLDPCSSSTATTPRGASSQT